MKQIELIMAQEAAKAASEWINFNSCNEEEARKIMRMILPSWRIKRDVGLGLYRSNGWRRNFIQLIRDGELIDVPFWDYDENHDRYSI